MPRIATNKHGGKLPSCKPGCSVPKTTSSREGTPQMPAFKDGGWIKKATNSIKSRGTTGKCTPISKPGCTGRARALALTFKKMARNHG